MGRPPLAPQNDALLFEKIRKGEYSMDDPIWQTISAEAKDLCRQLMNVDPVKRMTAENALKVPWVRGELPSQGAGLAGTQKTMAAVQVPKSISWRQSTTEQNPELFPGAPS